MMRSGRTRRAKRSGVGIAACPPSQTVLYVPKRIGTKKICIYHSSAGLAGVFQQSGLAVRRPAGRSQPSNGGLRRALREPLQADCAPGLTSEAEGVADVRRLWKRVLCLVEVQQRQQRRTVSLGPVGRPPVEAVAAVDYRAGRTTGPERSAVNGQGDLADLVCSSDKGRDDRTTPCWVQRQASAPV